MVRRSVAVVAGVAAMFAAARADSAAIAWSGACLSALAIGSLTYRAFNAPGDAHPESERTLGGGNQALTEIFRAEVLRDEDRLEGRALDEPAERNREVFQLREISKGLGALFVWAGLAMAACYYLTPQSWYHAYQYSAAFVLLGTVTVAVAMLYMQPTVRDSAVQDRALDGGADGTSGRVTPRWLWGAFLVISVTEALGGVAALVYLAESGKLVGHRADWIANVLFTTAAVSVVVASVAASPKLLGQVRYSSSG